MPFHEYILTKFGATIVLWQLTENEQTIATLLSEKERNLIDSQNLSPKRFCERAASRLSLNRIKETLNDDITPPRVNLTYSESPVTYRFHTQKNG